MQRCIQFTEDFGPDEQGARNAAHWLGRQSGAIHADTLPPKCCLHGWTARAIFADEPSDWMPDGCRSVVLLPSFRLSCPLA